jgi:hypothetical protein
MSSPPSARTGALPVRGPRRRARLADDTVRATELALRRTVAVTIATSDDIDAALATTLEGD